MDRSATEASRKRVAPPPLIERGRELAVLAGALDGAAAGSGSVTVIEGDPGTGKTRLLAEARELASERGLAVLSARGAELESGFPFGVMRQVFERAVAAMDELEARELLSGAAAPVESVLRGRAPAELPPRDALFSLVHGFYWLSLRVSERRPTLITIDDLQWVDEPSARALAYLAGRAEELAIAIVLATRTSEPVIGGAASVLANLEPTLLELRALSEEGTDALLGELLGSVDPSFAATAHAATGGNPFLVRELALNVAAARIETDERGARQIAELGPATVARWALGRIEGLPPAAAEVARSLSVLEQADLPLLAAHARVPADDAAEIVDRLAAAGIVDGSPLRLTHPIVRASLYERMSAPARERAHRSAAAALHDHGRPARVVASQLLRCRPRGQRWAVDALRVAAGEAATRGDAGQAARMLRRALAELDGHSEPGLLLELGAAESALHEGRAIEHLEAAVAAAGDGELGVAARGALAHAHYATGDFRGAFEAGREALDRIPPGRGGRLEAELLFSYLMAGRAIPELLVDVRRWLGEPRLGQRGEATPAELARLQIGALDAFMRGRRAEAARLAGSVDAALEAPGTLAQAPTLVAAGVGFVLAGLGDHDAARRVFDRCLDHALTRGSPLETAEALEGRVSALWWRGDVAGCLADVETILSLVGEEPDLAKVPFRMCQSTMLLERGDLDGAGAAIALPAELERSLPGTWAWLALPFGRARLALARREWNVAHREAVATGEHMAAIEVTSPEFFAWRSLAAQALAGAGQRQRARELTQQELDLAETIGSPRAIGTALAARAAIDADADAFAEAIESLDRAGALLEQARARVALGAMLRRERRARAAREPLREALDIALRAGSTVIAEHARSELQAAGARPRRDRMTGVAALTPRERQIAELAGTGIGNPEIAERLFVTRKTVEAHMRSVFRKLDVRAREQLPEALGIDA